MEDVALDVDHDVLVVTVFDLKDVTQQRIRSQRFAEVVSGDLVSLRPRRPKLPKEIVNQPLILPS